MRAGVSTNPAQVQAQAGVTTINEPGTVGRWATSVDRTARYVRVQLNGTWQLSLPEVVVAGKKLPPP